MMSSPRMSKKFEAEILSLTPARLELRLQPESDSILKKIVDVCLANVVVLDELGQIVYMSRAWRLFKRGRTPSFDEQEIAFRQLTRVKRRGVTTSLADDIAELLRGKVNEFQCEYVRSVRSATNWFLIHARRLKLSERGSFRVVITREDITRQKLAELELRNLGGRLIHAQEEERTRLARELHDDLNQQLAILSIALEQLGQQLPKERDDLNVRVRALWEKTEEISSEIHRLSYQLHPTKLDHLGLSAALKSLCEEISEHHELKVEFTQKDPPVGLSKEAKLCLYRVAQESLRNVTRHSGARTVKVHLETTDKAVLLCVSDNGVGFDTHSSETKTGLGLISMMERLRLVGGTISIQSRLNEGTRIDVIVPIKDNRLPVS